MSIKSAQSLKIVIESCQCPDYKMFECQAEFLIVLNISVDFWPPTNFVIGPRKSQKEKHCNINEYYVVMMHGSGLVKSHVQYLSYQNMLTVGQDVTF